MSAALISLREQKAKALAEARKINDLAVAEKRSLSGEENAKYDAFMLDFDKFEAEEARIVRLEEAEKRSLESAGRKASPAPIQAAGGDGAALTDRRNQPEYRSMFAAFLKGGVHAFGPVEHRALQADQDIYGGFLVPPTQWSNELLKAVDDAVHIKRISNVTRLEKAVNLGIPTLDADPADPDWTAEILTGSADSTMAFGKREINPHPLAKRIKVSRKLIQAAAMSVEQIVRERFAYKFALAEEKGFLTGTGSGQPLGVFTASNFGISTSRDVSTDNTTTAITADGLMNCFYSLKGQYQRTAEWVFHRDAIKMIRKLKDGQSQYIWSAGLSGQPGTILDRPFHISEWAPNTFTTGLYVGLLGDFRFYRIAEAMSYSIQRLDELYAESNEVGFIARTECDGMPVLEEAFARVKLA